MRKRGPFLPGLRPVENRRVVMTVAHPGQIAVTIRYISNLTRFISFLFKLGNEISLSMGSGGNPVSQNVFYLGSWAYLPFFSVTVAAKFC
ncbi:hypothetical protein X474_22635 [Dethiosulfatarculus sandiegensis]|uniref:Uncharacterized protein n=1 Tax=Dethiosulfatarculus sandiegensis TaxID=1429043 RepID=A0A0D2HMB8_9BACT|nr:hypothetical protein X474_22635 [Dethiosulfatarculus sandiegensis]